MSLDTRSSERRDLPAENQRQTTNDTNGSSSVALVSLRELDARQAELRRPPEDSREQRRREDDFFARFFADIEKQARRKYNDDGTSTKAQDDGSQLSYDNSGKLSRLTYADGTYREFRWDGDRLVATRTRENKWWDRVDADKNGGVTGWKQRDSGNVWTGDIEVDQENGTYRLIGKGQNKDYRLTSTSDGKTETSNADGTRTVKHGSKGSETYDRAGRLTQIITEDGTVRTFGRSQDGKLNLVTVKKPDGNSYEWKLHDDGKWYCNGEVSDTTFRVDSKNGEYIWTDGKTHEEHTLDARGNELIEGPERTKELQHGELAKVTAGGAKREFVRNSKGELTCIRDGEHELRRQADGTWKRFSAQSGKEEPDGFTRRGTPDIDKSTGEVLFLTEKGSVIKQEVGGKPTEIQVPEEVGKKIAASGLDDQAKMRMIQNISDFMQRQNISATEKKQAVDQVMRLLEGKGSEPFKKADCEKLAEQLSWHIAHPEKDAQGDHPTCNVSDIRISLEREQPATFARFIADSVLNGQFVTASGDTITPPRNESLLPGKEESQWPPQDGQRSWVGKISDVMMANIHWRRRETDPNGNPVARGSLYYDEVRPTGQNDSGSRIYRYEQQGANWYRYELAQSPSLYANGIEDIYQQITGKPETGRVVVHDSRPAGNGTAVVHSIDDLKEQLSHGPWPKIVQLQNDVLQGQKPDGKDHEHVVVVTGYDPKTGKVSIDNSHDSSEDMLLADKQISVEQLYRAMQARVRPVQAQPQPVRVYYTNGVIYYPQSYWGGYYQQSVYFWGN